MNENQFWRLFDVQVLVSTIPRHYLSNTNDCMLHYIIIVHSKYDYTVFTVLNHSEEGSSWSLNATLFSFVIAASLFTFDHIY